MTLRTSAEPKVGDVVKLKSGGPIMTIADITPDGLCRCQWFSLDIYHHNYFPVVALTRTEPNEPAK